MIVVMGRRREDQLVSNEQRVLRAALELLARNDTDFHGYLIAKKLREDTSVRAVAASTIYRCMDRLEERGLLVSRYSAPDGQGAGRRTYQLTGDGISVATSLSEPATAGILRLDSND